MRRVLGTRAVGHAGTLDPFATGLLVVLVGKATRLARFVEREAKGYLAVAELGVTTDTDDLTGAVVARSDPVAWPDEAQVRTALASLVGTYPQQPPAYSARRVGGRRAYELARAGRVVTLPATTVTVHALDLMGLAGAVVTFRAAVSAGTYVRAIARDLGQRLGTGAHLRALRREWIGPLRVEDAVAFGDLRPDMALLPALELIPGLPRVELAAAEVEAVRHGRPITGAGAEGEAALVHDGELVAMAEGADGAWQPRVVVAAA